MSFKTSINPLDFSSQIGKVIKFSNIILKNFVNMIIDIKHFIKKFVFSLFKYTYVFVIIATIILAGTLLFSKNKLGNILVLCYIFIIIIIAGLLSGVLALIIIVLEKIINICKIIEKLATSSTAMTVKNVFRIIVAILEIIGLLLLLFVIGIALVIICVVIDVLMGWNIQLFNTIDGTFKDLTPQTATTAIQSFGDLIKKGFENC